jgi:putative FmdB family regulatory protein
MPTYEYACSACGNAWEEIQKITEAPVELCPACKKATAKRQISGGTFILKGGGWYSDLYSSPKPSASKDDSSSKPEGKGAGESKSEAKSETRTSEPKGGGSTPAPSGSTPPAATSKAAAE